MGSSPQGSNCQWVTVSGDIQARSVGQGLSHGQWGKSQSWPPLQGAPVHAASERRWSGGPGDIWRAVSCWPPEPSLWPLLAGPRPWGGSDPLPASATSWQHRLPGMPSARPAPTSPTTWLAWGAWGPVGFGTWLPQRWRLRKVWGPSPEGAGSWALTLPGLDPGG